MKMRMMFLAMIPCLMIGCGVEAEPEDNSLRGEQVEPCLPEDCIPLAPAGGNDCPEGTEPASGAECVNADGECVWDFWEACVPVEGENPPPPPENPPNVHPSQGSPRDIAPRPN
ncbi:hypothetical protein ACNOYE_02840 [Nannocystaceae bacterium ST9]